jgi:lysozyme family protein
MTSRNFQTWYDFCEAPDDDGQPFHITEGDPGGATVYGWTYAMWRRVAPLHGITDTSLDAFKAQTKLTLEPLSRGTYWNFVQGDRLPSGIDLFWTDFQFGSGGATKALQRALGVPANGVVDSATLLFVATDPDALGMLDKLLIGRTGYYDGLGYQTRWPGLYRRARACHALASTLISRRPGAPPPAAVAMPVPVPAPSETPGEAEADALMQRYD